MFKPAYLDYNANCPIDARVREAMLPYLAALPDTIAANASSRHEYGRQARAAIDAAREQVAAVVGAHASEVIFTSGGSEANNLFLKGAAANMKPGVLAIGATEHPCVREPAQQLVRSGWKLHVCAVDANGIVDAAARSAMLEQKPQLISIMWANNETGVIQDVAAIAEAARKQGAWIHTDAVQAVGKLPVDFRALQVNALTISAHKIGGPIGVGALVLDKRVDLQPLIAGGGQERGLRSGTENVAAIVGFGAACELAQQDLDARAQQMEKLRTHLETRLQSLSSARVQIFAQQAQRLPNTSFFAFAGIDGETLVGKLDRKGFAVASGSACSSANPEPSHTLLAMGVAPEIARGAVRVSIGAATTQQMLDDFIAVLGETLQQLRNLASIEI